MNIHTLTQCKRAYTHGGYFHADDVFSTALLLYINPSIQIERGFTPPLEDGNTIIYDIGFGEYDHHQKNNQIRKNGIPYASFGKLWLTIGTEILGYKAAETFDQTFIQELDLNDNTGKKSSLATIIRGMNPVWNEVTKKEQDRCFFLAVEFAYQILVNQFNQIIKQQRAMKDASEIAKQRYQESDGYIVLFEYYVPCLNYLANTNAKFMIYPNDRGEYNIQTIPNPKRYGNPKVPFPKDWRGEPKDILKQKTKNDDITFCHQAGYLASAKTKDAAIQLCKQIM